jgi:hypothetical protein
VSFLSRSVSRQGGRKRHGEHCGCGALA